jgi:hypothetical protein
MRTQGEYLFNSLEEVKGFINKPTNYEQKNNIKIIGDRIIDLAEDFKIYIIKKSDNTETLFLLFKNSLKYDIWKFWTPSETQFDNLIKAHKIYTDINELNKQKRTNGF